MSDTVPLEQWHVHYEGRVQGVGFRYTTQRIASRIPVTGYVKNLHDGRVLLVAEGRPEDLQRLAERVDEELGRYIRRSVRTTSRPTGRFEGFEIRF